LSNGAKNDSFCTPADVELVMANGKTVGHRVTAMRGHPSNPMTLADAHRKLLTCTSSRLSRARQRRVVNMLLDLAQLSSIRPLSAATRPAH